MARPTMVVLSALLVFGATACGASSSAERSATPDLWCLADWTGVTIAPPTGQPAECPDPATREERALDAVVRLMTPETFAGMWFENRGQDLIVGYVGQAPDLADLPGVTALVERDMSLAEMEQLAAERNQDEDVAHQWRVNVGQGTVERISLEPIEFGDEIQTWEWCATAVPHWLEVGATDPDFYRANEAGTRLLHCVNEGTGEWEAWTLTPDGAEPYVP